MQGTAAAAAATTSSCSAERQHGVPIHSAIYRRCCIVLPRDVVVPNMSESATREGNGEEDKVGTIGANEDIK